MNLREIECFIAVADELHFGRAAHRLHLAQPTVSESVRRLERHLGGQLFDRSTRNVRLTELGGTFLKEAREAYARVEMAYETGRLLAHRRDLGFNVGATVGDEDLLVAGTAALSRRRPEVSVQFEEMNTLDQIHAILHRRIDVGVAWLPPAHEDIASFVLGETGYVAVVPQSNPLARHSVVSLERLAGEPLITWSRAANPALYERFAAAMGATGAPWSLVATANGVANLMSRVISGQGIGVVPSSAVRDRRLPGVCIIALGPDGPTAERTLIWPKHGPHLILPMFVNIMQRAWVQHRGAGHEKRQSG